MRKINSKVIAGALLAIQIAAAMPAAAFAGEIDSQAVTQEQTETEALAVAESGEEKASSETAQKQDAAETEEKTDSDKEEDTAPAQTSCEEAADEDTDAEDEESADEESANEESANEESENKESVDEEDTENADEQSFDKDQAAAAETVKDHNQEEKAEQGKAFDQSVTVDGVRINVKAEEGTFEDGARLSVTRFPSSGLKQVQNAIADARAKDTEAVFAYVFDIKVVGSDGSILKPADGKKVKVTFESEEMADNSLNAVVYHVVDANNNAAAQKLATAVNRSSKTAEVLTDGFSCYAVEFYRVGDADTTKADPEPVEEKNHGGGEEQKTEKTGKTGKTDSNTNDTKTVTTAKDSENTKKTETAVNKEKKSDTKKNDTIKKDKDKTKEKAKKETSRKSPKTGDEQNAFIWIVMSLLAVGGMIGLVFTRRRI